MKFYEMSNYMPNETGLLIKIWALEKTDKEKHWARIKVYYMENYHQQN
jgi:hypothetical protein